MLQHDFKILNIGLHCIIIIAHDFLLLKNINNSHRVGDVLFTSSDVSLKQFIDVEVFIILTKWIIQSLCSSQPSKDEEKLEDGEDGDDDITLLSADDPLVRDEGDGEEDINGEVNHLRSCDTV